MFFIRDKLKYYLIFFLSPALASTSFIPGHANELDRLRQQQKEISRQIQKYKRYIASKNVEIRDLNQQLAALDRDIEQTELKLAQLKDALALAEADLAQAEKDLARAEAEHKERLNILADRLRAIYKNGSVSTLEVLLRSASFTDFLVRFDLLQKIAEQDVALLQEIEARRQDIEAKGRPTLR
ncbi:MAG: murein hydrolase activator EnvC family protein [Desulfotomaculales bacterium]